MPRVSEHDLHGIPCKNPMLVEFTLESRVNEKNEYMKVLQGVLLEIYMGFRVKFWYSLKIYMDSRVKAGI